MCSRKSIRKGFQRFSDGTSLHGFTELYYSKTLFWRIVWASIVICSLVVTVYQLYGSIQNFIHQDSNTVILLATCDEVQFPPLKFCIAHWIYWIDWKDLSINHVSKETVLFGMSYLTNIYSSHYFNISEAEQNFSLLLKKFNISILVEFYKMFAVPALPKHYPVNSRLRLNETEIIILDGDPHFCYTVAGDNLKQFLSEKSLDDKNVFKFKWNALTKPHQIDDKEYNSYMAEWIIVSKALYLLTEIDGVPSNYSIVRSNYSAVIPPTVLLVNGYSERDIKLLPQIYEYNIVIKSSASRWKNKKIRKCHEGIGAFISNVSCNTNCLDKAYYGLDCLSHYAYRFSQAIKSKSNTPPSMLDRYDVYFLTEEYVSSTTRSGDAQQKVTYFDPNATMIYMYNNTETAQQLNTISINNFTTFLNPETGTIQQDTTALYISDTKTVTNNYDDVCALEKLDKIYSDCVAEICNIHGCDEWSFDVTVTTKSVSDVVKDLAYKTSTEAIITYPACGEVLVMTEIDSKTWEDFVGNVGGLLGIWTGASILSIFQLFYLCCFADTTERKFSLPTMLKRKHVQTDLLHESAVDVKKPNVFKMIFKKRQLKRVKSGLFNGAKIKINNATENNVKLPDGRTQISIVSV